MLDIIRKKKGSPWVKAILIGIAVSFFGGFGMLGYCGRREREAEMERMRAATVNEQMITITEVNRLASNMRPRTGPFNDADLIKAKEDALDTLINRELIFQEASRLGLQATNDEVDLMIIQMFQVEGIFQPQMYTNYLQNQGYTEDVYKERLRKDITIQKMMKLIGGAAIVTEDDLRQVYPYENEEASLALIEIDPESITVTEEPTTAEMSARYEENPDGYIINEKRSIRYSCFDSTNIADSQEFTDEEIEKYYEMNKEKEFALEHRKVRVRQIVLRVTPQTPKEERDKKREQAQEILTDARLGTSTFENLAKLYSEDPESRAKEGDMGWLDLGEKYGPVAEKLAIMKPGEMSDVIETILGFYIVRIEDEIPGKYKTLRRVRKEIIQALRDRKGVEWSTEVATAMVENIRGGASFEEATRAATAEVRLSPLFDQTATEIEGAPESEKLIQGAYQKLYEEDMDAEIVELENGACVIQIAKIEDSHDASYEEAEPMIREELKREARRKKAREAAEDLLKKIDEGMTFEKAATGPDVNLIQTKYFPRGRGMIPEVGFSEDLLTAAFSIYPHEPVSLEVFEVGGKFYLVKLIGRKEADPQGFEKQKENLKMRLTYQIKGELTQSWIDGLKARAAIDRKSMSPPEPQEESL